MKKTSQIAVYGLGVMGTALARNLGNQNFSVCVANRTVEKTRDFLIQYGNEGNFTAAESLEELMLLLERPRKILLMVKAGDALDQLLQELAPLLDEGDIVLDAGNSYYEDTQRRAVFAQKNGFHFLGVGVSGGEEGALTGPSMMVGGDLVAWQTVMPFLMAIAAIGPNGAKCCAYLGPDGAGHFVKMIHNGIEYAEMELWAETFLLLRRAGKTLEEIADVFSAWNSGITGGYLASITAAILRKKEPAGTHTLDTVLDCAADKGTGRWSTESAMKLGIPVSTVAEAVFARLFSSSKSERLAGAHTLTGPAEETLAVPGDFANQLHRAFDFAKCVIFSQNFTLLAAASKEYNWNLPLPTIASIWRGGCIIRSGILDTVRDAYAADPQLPRLLFAPEFAAITAQNHGAAREVASLALRHGVPVPVLASAIGAYDMLRTRQLPANLIQAQRDCFGAHTYERVDAPRGTYFHSDWLR